jgi:monovalent cation:H+ antiporter, CPA1 family
VIAPYEAKIEAARAVEAAAEAMHGLTEADRLAIALVALSNRERVTFIEMLRDGIASPGVVRALVRNADALAEAARSDGRAGYEKASDAALVHPSAFHIAYFLYRRFGIVWPLADRLAERLEILLVTRFAIERLMQFIDQKVAILFGAPIAVEVRVVVVGRRQQAIASALDALRRQYPGYLAELEVRFLRQSTLHHEMVRYQSLFEEGLISLEIYDDLKRNTQGAHAAERPRFDIGLDTHQLVKRLDLLAGLDERQLESVCRLLRPRFAVPQERIIRKGERGDAVYFIVSGAVEVVLPERDVRLGSGEFFGELALLSGRSRRADVMALTYCQFLVLRRADFELFMKANPEARDTILRVAEARRMINISDRRLPETGPV